MLTKLMAALLSIVCTCDSIYAIACICHSNSVCPSVCLSVTYVLCTKTAERIIKILSPCDRPIILVFTARSYALRGIAMACCPSVRPSVTLRYRDHIRSNSAKIISRLISITISLSADPNMMDLLQSKHPQILAVSRKRCKIGSKLLLTTNMNMYTRFRLVPKSMTLDDL